MANRSSSKHDPERDDIPVFATKEAMLIGSVLDLQADLVAAFIHAGTDVNTQDEQGMTPLHHAVLLGARPCIRVLVNSGLCDYTIRDHFGRCASDIAVKWTRDYAVGRLLSKKQAMQESDRKRD